MLAPVMAPSTPPTMAPSWPLMLWPMAAPKAPPTSAPTAGSLPAWEAAGNRAKAETVAIAASARDLLVMVVSILCLVVGSRTFGPAGAPFRGTCSQ